MPETAAQLFEILRVLAANQVEFIIVGGVCAVLQGSPITTFDLDVVHSRLPDNLNRLMKSLKGLDAYYRGHPMRLQPDTECLSSPGHHLLMTRLGPLDLLGTIGKGEGYNELLEHSEELRVEQLRFRVLSLEYLIKTKEHTSREKDRLALTILRNTLKERQQR